jgi:hypothetical protein
MGFDLNIIINTGIDEKTGLPFVWGENFEQNEYVPSAYQIPEKYRKYISQRGYHFHNYILHFDDNTNQCDADIFLNFYPEWSEELIEESDGWTVNDHNEFKECLEWLTSKGGVFGIRWSY